MTTKQRGSSGASSKRSRSAKPETGPRPVAADVALDVSLAGLKLLGQRLETQLNSPRQDACMIKAYADSLAVLQRAAFEAEDRVTGVTGAERGALDTAAIIRAQVVAIDADAPTATEETH